MRLLYKLFRQDINAREGVITTTSILGILTNLLIALIKVIVGALASSIAIVSEGINNATDALNSVLTLVGTKLAGKHPDAKHPFGYGRIEYLTGLVIAVIILMSGTELLINSVKLIFEPAELSISYVSLAVVAVSAVIKFLLGVYTQKMGEKVDSSALVGVGKDSKADSFASLVTILSALVFLIFGRNIDAFAGVITSAFIIKAGLEVLSDTVSSLLGRPASKDLAEEIYREVLETPGVLGAADMMLHNYGPDAYSGSVNIEIDHETTIGEIYQTIHKLQLDIYHKHQVIIVFGMYAVDNDHEESRQIRKDVALFSRNNEHISSFHAIYLEPDTHKIYCDLVVDYDLRDWDGLRKEFTEYMKERYPESELELTIETEFV